jgi:hypothetical protein
VDDLVQWLGEQYDADESAIRDCLVNDEPNVSEHDLVDIDAKRQILALHRPVQKRSTGSGGGIIQDCSICDHFPAQYPCMTVRLLALPYSGRSGYLKEWRP